MHAWVDEKLGSNVRLEAWERMRFREYFQSFDLTNSAAEVCG